MRQADYRGLLGFMQALTKMEKGDSTDSDIHTYMYEGKYMCVCIYIYIFFFTAKT